MCRDGWSDPSWELLGRRKYRKSMVKLERTTDIRKGTRLSQNDPNPLHPVSNFSMPPRLRIDRRTYTTALPCFHSQFLEIRSIFSPSHPLWENTADGSERGIHTFPPQKWTMDHHRDNKMHLNKRYDYG